MGRRGWWAATLLSLAVLVSFCRGATADAAEIGVVPPSAQPDAKGRIYLTFTGPAGAVTVGDDPACADYCVRAVKLGGKAIFEDDFVDIFRVIPSLQRPELLIVKHDCGGNACGRESLVIVDISKAGSAKVIESMVLVRDAKLTQNGTMLDFNGSISGEENQYGDILTGTLRYDRTRQIAYRVRQSRDLNDIRFLGKHPDELFADLEFRKRLAPLLGADYKTVRQYSGTAGPISLADYGRYLVADGMQPHSGGDQSAIVVIDLAYEGIWAATVSDKSKFKLWGTIADDDYELRAIFDKWLFRWGRKLIKQ